MPAPSTTNWQRFSFSSAGRVALGHWADSAAMRAEPAIQYALAHYHRKAHRYNEAASVLLKMPRDHAKLYNPDEVWTERRLVARGLLAAALRASLPSKHNSTVSIPSNSLSGSIQICLDAPSHGQPVQLPHF
jgi:hypothetical protein